MDWNLEPAVIIALIGLAGVVIGHFVKGLTDRGAAPAGGEAYAAQHALTVASRKDIEQAWQHSMTSQPYHSRRGHDEAIITDQMILTAVQALKEG